MEKLVAKQNFQLTRISQRDAAGQSDHLRNLRSLVSEKDDLYPGIDRWFDRRVIDGLSDASRRAYVGYVDEVPAAAAIIKLGVDAKVCHINVREDLRRTGVGELLLSLITMEARASAKSVHITFPRSLWAAKSHFFINFGFGSTQLAPRQYRLFNDELSARTLYSNVWSSILRTIPKLAKRFSLSGTNMDGGVLFSIQPQFGRQIMSGSKTIEIRRRFSEKWKGQRAVFYASEPSGALLGQAHIGNVHRASPDEIWKQYHEAIGCDYEYFSSYVHGCEEIFAIELENADPLVQPIYSSTLRRYSLQSLTPPQSYVALTDKQGWSEAVNVSVMLQCLDRAVQLSTASTK
jgi:predicted transcriptional regulator/GNAT superfamily N-acetyltransferase